MSANVNREGLDYRAGWVEALKAFAARLNLEGVRAKKNQIAGMELASQIAQQMFKDMLDKMREAGKAAVQDAAPGKDLPK